MIKRNCGLTAYPCILLVYPSDHNMEGKAAGGERDYSSRLLWQPPAAAYKALEMYNELYKAHMLKALGLGGSTDVDPTALTPLYQRDTWKSVSIAAECTGCGSWTHCCSREGKSKNVRSSLKI